MRESRYAVVELSFWDSELHVHVLEEGFTDIKEAEKTRENTLKGRPKMSPQMVQVMQYVS